VPSPMLTDSGLETWLVFHRNVELPDFASFPLLDDERGRSLLREYFEDHVAIAERSGTGIVLETPTWRANADWGARLEYDAGALDRVNQDAVRFLREVASSHPDVDVVVSGNLGPRGDGYQVGAVMTAEEAAAYHRPQIASFVAAGADRVTMLTATYAAEAEGVVRAASGAGIPVVVAFTAETDGRLPSGQPLHEAVAAVDAATDGAALAFGVNCAHPDHFREVLAARADDPAVQRLGLLRANASRMSHAELDEAEELDAGDPEELADLYRTLLDRHPNLEVLGGCCGTDSRHVAAIAARCVAAGAS